MNIIIVIQESRHSIELQHRPTSIDYSSLYVNKPILPCPHYLGFVAKDGEVGILAGLEKILDMT